ncbi:MAG: nucleotidyltransferase family protein [Patescibacteria group bacterium]
MKKDLLAITSLLKEKKDILRNDFSVKEIGVFGSYATGENKTTSDIDIIVELSQPVGMFTFLELEEYLSNLFDKKVDLTTKKSLKPLIKKDILQNIVYV